MVNELGNDGIKVHFRWVPGHAAIHGNIKADRLAGIASASQFGCIKKLTPPVNGYLETPPTTNNTKIALQSLRQDSVEWAVFSRDEPVRRLNASRQRRSVDEILLSTQGSFILDILDCYIDEELADDEDGTESSLSGMQA